MSRALVLGGGGPVGIAWESGLLAGLAENGVDLSTSDFIVGHLGGFVRRRATRAGKVACAVAAPDLAGAVPAPAAERPSAGSDDAHHENARSRPGKRPAEEVRAEIGAWALNSPAMSEEDFIARFAPSLGGDFDGPWP